MSFEKIAEEKIREAIAKGEFDNLEGKGKPIDHSAYFAAPADVRLGYSMLKSNGFVPEDVALLKEIESLRAAAQATADPDQKRRIERARNLVMMKLELMREARKRRSLRAPR
jgi:DnaJ-like protein